MQTSASIHDNRERKALTVTFVEPQERAFKVQAGRQGLQALVLNFPRVNPISATTMLPSASAFKRWQCMLCAFSYDEALGLPEDGIPAGTRWEDVPQAWSCPDCSARKSDFERVEV